MPAIHAGMTEVCILIFRVGERKLMNHFVVKCVAKHRTFSRPDSLSSIPNLGLYSGCDPAALCLSGEYFSSDDSPSFPDCFLISRRVTGLTRLRR
jgi:hypothetical protein